MSLKDRLAADVVTAMKSGERDRLGVLRMVHAAIKQREVDERISVDDPMFLAIVEKMVKQRRESEKMFRDGDRPELADKEAAEISIISEYLPEPLGEAEIAALIDEAIEKTGAESIRDMGKVMGVVKATAQGRADMGKVGAAVKARLG